MSPLLIKISKDFATIWTTIDPIGNVAIFAGLTASLTRAERRRTALRATVYAALILVVAVVAGGGILFLIGVFPHPPHRGRRGDGDDLAVLFPPLFFSLPPPKIHALVLVI